MRLTQTADESKKSMIRQFSKKLTRKQVMSFFNITKVSDLYKILKT